MSIKTETPQGVGTEEWIGGDTPDEPSSAWTELRNRWAAGEKPQEYRWPDGTRGWLLYTMKQEKRVAVLWEHNRHEALYLENDPRLLTPIT